MIFAKKTQKREKIAEKTQEREIIFYKKIDDERESGLIIIDIKYLCY